MSRRLFAAMLTLVCSLVVTFAYADVRPQDVVYLHNGSTIRGTILEQVPNQSLRIRTGDGSEFVFKMDEVARITQEASRQDKPSSGAQFSKSSLISVNPMGLGGGGVSWIGLERYLAPNVTYQSRLDLWNYAEEEDEEGYAYTETQKGFGAGVSVRGYTLSKQPFCGLFGGFGVDAVYTSWNWTERATSYSPELGGDGTSLAGVFSAQVGYAFGAGNFRIEPSLLTGYFAISGDHEDLAGMFGMLSLQFGLVF